jgi:hypothetical protein
MIEVVLDEADRLDWALKQFKRKVRRRASSGPPQKAPLQPSEVRQRRPPRAPSRDIGQSAKEARSRQDPLTSASRDADLTSSSSRR